METKSSFLALFEKVESFASRLPGALQKPILAEVGPLKDLFLRQRAPRIVVAGDPAAGAEALCNAIFAAQVATGKEGEYAGGWQGFSHLGKRVLRVLDARLAAGGEPSELVGAAIRAEAPDLFLFLLPPLAGKGIDAAQLDQLENLLNHTEAAHNIRPCVIGVVVETNETGAADLVAADQSVLQAALSGRPRLAAHLAPTQAVSTFLRFRLDGTFDPESDRRRGIPELVDVLVAELPNEARLEMARLSGAKAAQTKIAQTLIKSFTAASGALGAQPIPLADLPFLLGFQLAMVAGIIYISGRELSLKLATEFLGTLGMNIGVGLAFREGARAAVRAATKLFLPGIGNAISGFVAAAGTYAVGRAALAYYIEGVNLAEAKAVLKRSRRPDKRVFQLLDRRKKSAEQNGVEPQ